MKPKTIAESIAELRNRLEEIDSSAPAVSNTLIQESNSLRSHMDAIESEYLSERGVIGAGFDFLGNAARGVGLQGAKGAAKDWEAASKSDTIGNTLGKIGTLGGVYAAGADKLPDVHMPSFGGTTPPVTTPPVTTPPVTTPPVTTPPTTEKPEDEHVYTSSHKSGGGAKPHQGGLKYDPEVEMLQQYLNSKGANLVVDGLKGEKTRAAIEKFMSPDGQAPAGQTASATQAAAPIADAEFNSQMQSNLDQLKGLMAKIQQLSGNDQSVAQDLQKIIDPLQ